MRFKACAGTASAVLTEWGTIRFFVLLQDEMPIKRKAAEMNDKIFVFPMIDFFGCLGVFLVSPEHHKWDNKKSEDSYFV